MTTRSTTIAARAAALVVEIASIACDAPVASATGAQNRRNVGCSALACVVLLANVVTYVVSEGSCKVVMAETYHP